MFILILSGKTFRHSGDIPSYMDVHVVHVANTFFHSHFPSLSYLYLFYCVYLYHGQVSCRSRCTSDCGQWGPGYGQI